MNLMYVMWHPTGTVKSRTGTLIFVFNDSRVAVEQRGSGWWVWEDDASLPVRANQGVEEVEEYLAERMGVSRG